MGDKQQTREEQIIASLRKLPGSDDLVHLLWEASLRTGTFTEPLMAKHTSLSRAALGSLELVAHWPGITASELARVAFKTQQAVAQITSRLERLGYIERRLGSGRGVGLYITDAGEQARAEGGRAARAADRQLSKALGADRHAELKELLREALRALAETRGTDAGG